MSLSPYGPEFELEAGEVACDVHGEPARALELLPQFAAALELEVVESRVIGDLTRRDRQRAKRNARQLQVHLYLGGQDVVSPGITGAMIGGMLAAAAKQPGHCTF